MPGLLDPGRPLREELERQAAESPARITLSPTDYANICMTRFYRKDVGPFERLYFKGIPVFVEGEKD